MTFDHLSKKQHLINICRERTEHLFGPLIAFVLFPASAKASRLGSTVLNTGKNVGFFII